MAYDLKPVLVPYITRQEFDAYLPDKFIITLEDGTLLEDEAILNTQFNYLALKASVDLNDYVAQGIQICGGVEDVENENGITKLPLVIRYAIKRAVIELVGDWYRGSRPYYENVKFANLASGPLAQNQANQVYEAMRGMLSPTVKQKISEIEEYINQIIKNPEFVIEVNQDDFARLHQENTFYENNYFEKKVVFKSQATHIPIAVNPTDVVNRRTLQEQIQVAMDGLPVLYVFNTVDDANLYLNRAKTQDKCRIIQEPNIDPNSIFQCVIDLLEGSPTYGEKIWTIFSFASATDAGQYRELLDVEFPGIQQEIILTDDVRNYNELIITYRDADGNYITGNSLPCSEIQTDGSKYLDFGSSSYTFPTFISITFDETELRVVSIKGKLLGGVIIADLANTMKINGDDEYITSKKTFQHDVLLESASTNPLAAVRKAEQDFKDTSQDQRATQIETDLATETTARINGDTNLQNQIDAITNSMFPVGSFMLSKTAPTFGTWVDKGVIETGQSIIGGATTNGENKLHLHNNTISVTATVYDYANNEGTGRFGSGNDNTPNSVDSGLSYSITNANQGTDDKNRAWGLGIGDGVHIWERTA